jgi:hypothetical protein
LRSTFVPNIRSVTRRTFYYFRRRLLVSHSFCITVVRDPQSDHNYHRRHADASLSNKFRLRVFQRVRRSSIRFVFPAQCSRCRFRVHESPQVSNLTPPKTKRTDTPSSALDRVEISIHTAIERHATGSTTDDDSSTIISTSEQTPETIGHPSKVSLVEHPHVFCQPSLCLLVFLRHQRHFRCLTAFPFTVSG